MLQRCRNPVQRPIVQRPELLDADKHETVLARAQIAVRTPGVWHAGSCTRDHNLQVCIGTALSEEHTKLRSGVVDLEIAGSEMGDGDRLERYNSFYQQLHRRYVTGAGMEFLTTGRDRSSEPRFHSRTTKRPSLDRVALDQKQAKKAVRRRMHRTDQTLLLSPGLGAIVEGCQL